MSNLGPEDGAGSVGVRRAMNDNMRMVSSRLHTAMTEARVRGAIEKEGRGKYALGTDAAACAPREDSTLDPVGLTSDLPLSPAVAVLLLLLVFSKNFLFTDKLEVNFFIGAGD